jgi:hypothetical protein
VEPSGFFPRLTYSEPFTLSVDASLLGGVTGPFSLKVLHGHHTDDTPGWHLSVDGVVVPQAPALLVTPLDSPFLSVEPSYFTGDASPHAATLTVSLELVSSDDPSIVYAEASLRVALEIEECVPAPLGTVVFANRPSSALDPDTEIWMLTGGVASRRTSNTEVEDLDPAWSARRSEIAFVSNRVDPARLDTAIVVMPASSLEDALQEIVVSDFPAGTSASQPAWSPMGRKISK